MKYSKFIIIIFLGVLVSSCEDFLSPDPTSAIPTGDFYNSAEDLQLGLIAVYDAIQGVNDSGLDDNRGIQVEFYVTEMYSDNTNTSSANADDTSDAGQFENYSVQANNGISANYYASMYRVIFLANKVIDSLNVVDDESTSLAIEAEAKFLRAYAYFNLIRLYGEDSENLGLPLVDHVLTDDEIDTQYTRVSENEIYALIISDLEKAIEGLDDSYKTRASKTAANVLLGTVYMTIDTPNYVLANSYLSEAYNANYNLLSSLQDIFGDSNELNNEIIFAIGFDGGNSTDSQNFSSEFYADGNTSGVNYLTEDLYGALYNNADGNSSDLRNLLYVYEDEDEEDNNDGDRLIENTVDDGKKIAKFIALNDKFDSQNEQGGCDWIVLRYAEVIMLLAESQMGINGNGNVTVTDYDWGTQYNEIRTRAGLTTVTSISQADLLLERRLEFFGENKRLFTLKRYGIADQVLSDFAGPQGFGFSANEVTLPIPLREINLSPIVNGEHILVQNIAWR